MAPKHPLRTYLEGSGETLQQLAILVGSTKATLSRICLRKQSPSVSLIRRLVKATDGAVTADDLVSFAPATEAEETAVELIDPKLAAEFPETPAFEVKQ